MFLLVVATLLATWFPNVKSVGSSRLNGSTNLVLSSRLVFSIVTKDLNVVFEVDIDFVGNVLAEAFFVPKPKTNEKSIFFFLKFFFMLSLSFELLSFWKKRIRANMEQFCFQMEIFVISAGKFLKQFCNLFVEYENVSSRIVFLEQDESLLLCQKSGGF